MKTFIKLITQLIFTVLLASPVWADTSNLERRLWIGLDTLIFSIIFYLVCGAVYGVVMVIYHFTMSIPIEKIYTKKVLQWLLYLAIGTPIVLRSLLQNL